MAEPDEVADVVGLGHRMRPEASMLVSLFLCQVRERVGLAAWRGPHWADRKPLPG